MSAGDVLALLQGAVVTVTLSLTGILIGLPIGLGLAVLRWANVPVVARVVTVYVSILRATPLVTLLLLLFFALPNVGIAIGPISAAILALVMNTAAFNCEVWRASLMNFPKDQYEAAQSVGMGAGLRLRRIVLPQIARASLPGLVNEMSLLIKVTPVLAVVGVVDITRAAVRIGAETFDPLRMDILLLMAPTASSIGYEGSGDYAMLADGALRKRKEHQVVPFVYAGAAILSPTIFASAPHREFSLTKMFDAANEQERLFGLRLDGVWMHVGTPDAIGAAEEAFLESVA